MEPLQSRMYVTDIAVSLGVNESYTIGPFVSVHFPNTWRFGVNSTLKGKQKWDRIFVIAVNNLAHTAVTFLCQGKFAVNYVFCFP